MVLSFLKMVYLTKYIQSLQGAWNYPNVTNLPYNQTSMLQQIYFHPNDCCQYSMIEYLKISLNIWQPHTTGSILSNGSNIIDLSLTISLICSATINLCFSLQIKIGSQYFLEVLLLRNYFVLGIYCFYLLNSNIV